MLEILLPGLNIRNLPLLPPMFLMKNGVQFDYSICNIFTLSSFISKPFMLECPLFETAIYIYIHFHLGNDSNDFNVILYLESLFAL